MIQLNTNEGMDFRILKKWIYLLEKKQHKKVQSVSAVRIVIKFKKWIDFCCRCIQLLSHKVWLIVQKMDFLSFYASFISVLFRCTLYIYTTFDIERCLIQTCFTFYTKKRIWWIAFRFFLEEEQEEGKGKKEKYKYKFINL